MREARLKQSSTNAKDVDWLRFAVHFVVGFIVGAVIGLRLTFAWQGLVAGGIVLGFAAGAIGDRLWWPLFYLFGISSRQMKGSIDAMNRDEDFSIHRPDTKILESQNSKETNEYRIDS